MNSLLCEFVNGSVHEKLPPAGMGTLVEELVDEKC
jgi:hypothetical protein